MRGPLGIPLGLLLPGLAGSLLLIAAAPEASRSDSRRDLQGIWEARNTAAASLEAHSADAGIRGGRERDRRSSGWSDSLPALGSREASRELHEPRRRRSGQQVLVAGSAPDHLHAVPYRIIPVADRPQDNRPHIQDAIRLFEGFFTATRFTWSSDSR